MKKKCAIGGKLTPKTDTNLPEVNGKQLMKACGGKLKTKSC